MSQQFHAMALVVRDYDEAIDWYTRKLGFELLEDTAMAGAKRCAAAAVLPVSIRSAG